VVSAVEAQNIPAVIQVNEVILIFFALGDGLDLDIGGIEKIFLNKLFQV
jgi:hypothetical protein